jgi:hypothetical protein
MSKLTNLLCGSPRRNGKLAESLQHMSATLSVLERALRTVRRPTAKDRLTAPFLIRSVIEISCTSLIARLDAFRILTLAEVQRQKTYDPTTKVGCAFQWQGDVMNTDGAVKNMWDVTKKPLDMSRALLGDYQEQVLWRPSFFAC